MDALRLHLNRRRSVREEVDDMEVQDVSRHLINWSPRAAEASSAKSASAGVGAAEEQA